MPHAAARACAKDACTGLVRNGTCNVCGPIRRGKDRAYDQQRGTANERGYGATWQRLRRMVLASEPLCRRCKNGSEKIGGVVMVVPATEVHHIIAKRNGGEDTFENLEPLCKSCHSKATAGGE